MLNLLKTCKLKTIKKAGETKIFNFMKKQLLLIVLCFALLNTIHAQAKQIVSIDGAVLDNVYTK